MTPPEAEGKGRNASPPGPAAVSLLVEPLADLPAPLAETPRPRSTIQPVILRKRADFLRAASARRQGVPGFLLQARQRDDGNAALRVGYTCSKKLGNAVMRNRAKRRLREIARALMPALGRPGWDYVLVGRPGATAERPFDDLLSDLRSALLKIHDAPIRADGPAPPRGKRRGKGKAIPAPASGPVSADPASSGGRSDGAKPS
ncbi:ribonuclease P protein component [Tabrizicola sp. DMG-N-6]|uniref:Ribonuclease P protein component n=1 Tax=Szabonella alba TaxID=2804194 RepID=A0A8K0VCY4_9RHOB|nr:ribonuclease P protein component [Szabonella alba]